MVFSRKILRLPAQILVLLTCSDQVLAMKVVIPRVKKMENRDVLKVFYTTYKLSVTDKKRRVRNM